MLRLFYENYILKRTRAYHISDKHAHIGTILIVVALISWSILLFRWLNHDSQRAVTWSLMPDTTVIAFELPEAPSLWRKIKRLVIWNNIQEIPYFEQLHQELSLVDSLHNSGQDLDEFFKKKSVFTSMHLTSNKNFDYVFYIPYKISENVLLKEFRSEIQRRFSITFDQREYQGIRIYEMVIPDTEKRFSYILHQNHLIGSFTPLLIEDVIRTVSDINRENFVSSNPELFALNADENPSDGKMYINMKRLPDILATFSDDKIADQLTNLSRLSEGLSSVFNLSDRVLSLKGKSSVLEDEEENSNYLSLFKDQKASEFEGLTQFIPRRTAFFFRWGFDDGEKLYHTLKSYRQSLDHFQANFDEQIRNEYNVNPAEIMKLTDGEVALTVMENHDDSPTDRLIFVRIKEPRKVQGLMWQLAQNSATDTAIFENYGDLRITRIDVPEMPQKMFGDMFNGFQKTWFSMINNYLILSNSVRGLKMLSDDLDKRETWAHLPKQTQMLGLSDTKSNICVKINMLRSWNTFTQNLSPQKQLFFEEFKRQFLRFEFFTYQVTHKRKKYETAISLIHRMPQTLTNSKNKHSFRAHTNTLNAKPITPPMIVRNHHSKSDEVMIQDAQFNLYQISKNGKKRWRTPINGAIITPIYQVDYYKNGKIQYLFSTKKSLYLIDRLGRHVANYPYSPNHGITLHHLSVFDLDKLKNYKFVSTDLAGNIYVYTKFKTPQRGWNPKKLDGTLVESPRHVRVEGIDYVIAVRQIGTVDVLSIHAQNHAEFPLDFGVQIDNPSFLQLGDNPKNTYLTILTKEGELIKLALSGQIINRNKLARVDATTDYTLCKAQPTENEYIVARHDGKAVTFISKNGQVIFSKTFPTASKKEVQYFSFGANTRIFAVTDSKLRKTWLYYSDGGMLYDKPLDSDSKIEVRYSEIDDVFEVYKNYGRKTEMLRIVKH